MHVFCAITGLVSNGKNDLSRRLQGERDAPISFICDNISLLNESKVRREALTTVVYVV